MAKAADTSDFLIRGLLHCYYWFDEGLQNSLKLAGLPGLSRTKCMIMVFIADGITRPSDLARDIGITRQAIQQTLVEMERDGLITLAPDPTDGRAKVVCFSRRGADVGEAAFDAIRRIETELGRRVGADAVKALKEILFRDWGPAFNADRIESGNKFSARNRRQRA